MTVDDPSPVYQCSVCRRRFPAEQLYDVQGSITCTDCYAKLNAAAQDGSAIAAQTALPPAITSADATSPQTTVDSTHVPAPAAERQHATAPGPLLAKVTCPHCWHRFAPEEILWVARHAELAGDPVLGPHVALRFLPARFTVQGAAIDPRGMTCQELACPECHLVIPRALLEAEPLFASIVGVSASGKSYFLTAMTWQLRQLLPSRFCVAFADADPLTNRTLNLHEQTLFLPADPERPVKLDKTDVVGSLQYDQIHVGQQVISLPRPLLFTMLPMGRHPNAQHAAQLARVVCLYDNAGEHFDPGQDTASSPVTQHLGRSRVLMFLYDPTQDPRFRARCRELSRDPQLDDRAPTRRQETVLLEMLVRVRQYGGLSSTEKVDRPLVIIVPKADVWGPLCQLDLSREPIVLGAAAGGALDAVDVGRVEEISAIVREMLLEVAPEFVLAAESFCTNVVYIPVSALGGSPEMHEGSEALWIRPSRLRPEWVAVPFLYMFARWSHDLIAAARMPAGSSEV